MVSANQCFCIVPGNIKDRSHNLSFFLSVLFIILILPVLSILSILPVLPILPLLPILPVLFIFPILPILPGFLSFPTVRALYFYLSRCPSNSSNLFWPFYSLPYSPILSTNPILSKIQSLHLNRFTYFSTDLEIIF